MRINLILIFLFGQQVVAQTAFFIAPLINHKIYLNSYAADSRFGWWYFEHENIAHQNPYYTFDAVKISNRPSINIGVRIGGVVKEKHFFLLEWSQDEAGTMSKTSTFGTTNLEGSSSVDTPYKTYVKGLSYFQTGFAFNRISFSYGSNLSKKERLTKLYFRTDISITYGKANQASWLYENWTSSTSTYYHNDARWVSTEIKSYYFGRPSVLLGVGLNADIHLKFKEKEIYLFTLEATYRQGFRRLVYSSSKTIIEDNNELIGFSDGLTGKGSGIYFQISRKFPINFLINKKQSNRSMNDFHP